MAKDKDTEGDDVNEAEAAKAEAERGDDDRITVTWEGQEWVLPQFVDIDAAAIEGLEQGKAMVFLAGALGPKQWQRFQRGDRRSFGAAAELMNLIMREGYGLDGGE